MPSAVNGEERHGDEVCKWPGFRPPRVVVKKAWVSTRKSKSWRKLSNQFKKPQNPFFKKTVGIVEELTLPSPTMRGPITASPMQCI
jgi:hypothetical protein